MAFLDFLSKPTQGYAQGPMPSGQAGIPQGPTWGELIGAALSASGGQGGQFFGSQLMQQYNPNAIDQRQNELMQMNQIKDRQRTWNPSPGGVRGDTSNPAIPQTQVLAHLPSPQKKEEENTSVSDIMSIASFFGFGA